jgi:putative ABC transport system permease protein
MAVMRALLLTFSWQELRHHPWRNAAAMLAVMLGVALAFAVQLINASALSEFASAVHGVSGEPDVELRSALGVLDEELFPWLERNPEVAVASPLLELNTVARPSAAPASAAGSPVRVVGIDALKIAAVAPAMLPIVSVPVPGTTSQAASPSSLFSPDTVFLNATARQTLLPAGGDSATESIQVQVNGRWHSVKVTGAVSAPGPALVVMDLGAAQDLFDKAGSLSRVALRLQTGVEPSGFLATLRQSSQWPAHLLATRAGDADTRIGNLARAYRVNLTVLALVALFTGAFLVFSVLSLSVAKRAQQFALLGVLGLSGPERMRLVLLESCILGVLGSALGIALGGALAGVALRQLGGDLGGGYFAGAAPPLQWSSLAAAVYFLLGVQAALVGGWWPAQQAQKLPPAQTLKGLGLAQGSDADAKLGLLLLAAAAVLSQLPPIAGVPLAAYLAVGLLLLGGIALLPWLIAAALHQLAPLAGRQLLALLAVERARRVRHSAAVAISGVVAALSLAVALTVMVASFRDSVTHWLDSVLPADLYARSQSPGGLAGSLERPGIAPELVLAIAWLPGVQRLSAQQSRALLLDPTQPAVWLLTRADPTHTLPLREPALPTPAGKTAIYVSEAMLDLYGARLGADFTPLAAPLQALAQGQAGAAAHAAATQGQVATTATRYFVAGVWRDYARQFGSIAMDPSDYRALTGDLGVNDLSIWLADGTSSAQVQQGIRRLAQEVAPEGAPLEMAGTAELRATSLRIFDRSFAVTYWLQAVAIGIGLFGVAASFSAQVLARRKEFGLLVHLGLTRRQILGVVAGEGAAWTATGALAGLGLGLAVSLVLVKVVNPQSFHWSMDLLLPWGRLAGLCAAVVVAGTVTAWLSGRAAAGRDAVLAVKEDW